MKSPERLSLDSKCRYKKKKTQANSERITKLIVERRKAAMVLSTKNSRIATSIVKLSSSRELGFRNSQGKGGSRSEHNRASGFRGSGCPKIVENTGDPSCGHGLTA